MIASWDDNKPTLNKFRHSEADAGEDEEQPQGWTKTLPKSWRDTKLLTNVKERDIDDDTGDSIRTLHSCLSVSLNLSLHTSLWVQGKEGED